MLLIRQKILLENDCQETSNMMPLSFHPQFVCLKKDLKVRVFFFLFFFSPPFNFKPTQSSAPPRKLRNLLVVVFLLLRDWFTWTLMVL